MNNHIELPELVRIAWEDTCRAFVPRERRAERQLQELLVVKLVERRLTRLKIDYVLPSKKKIDVAVGEKAFVELELHLKAVRKRGWASDYNWEQIEKRHWKPSFERLDESRRIHPEASRYYGIYSYLPFDVSIKWWKKLKEMCDEHKTEFLCVCHNSSCSKCP
jgi:hypothetical protein